MSRSWKQERTTPKGTGPVVARKPRMSDFSRQMYTDRGYTVEIPEVDAQDPLDEFYKDSLGLTL